MIGIVELGRAGVRVRVRWNVLVTGVACRVHPRRRSSASAGRRPHSGGLLGDRPMTLDMPRRSSEDRSRRSHNQLAPANRRRCLGCAHPRPARAVAQPLGDRRRNVRRSPCGADSPSPHVPILRSSQVCVTDQNRWTGPVLGVPDGAERRRVQFRSGRAIQSPPCRVPHVPVRPHGEASSLPDAIGGTPSVRCPALPRDIA